MSRINTNVSSLISRRILGNNNKDLTRSLERLSTGLRINRGSDGPADLIASEKLRSEKAALTAAIGNAERADQVSNIAEGGLNEIQTLLTELQGLVSSTANETGLSDDEKEANQLQVDQILQTIDRIASVTSFNGTKLLNGGLDFQVTGVAGTVSDFQVNGAKIESGSTVAVQAVVTASAQHAGLFLSHDGSLDLTNASDTFVIEVGGTKGSRQFSFASGATNAQITAAVNQFKSVTGVSAATSGDGVVLKSTEYGSDQFVTFDIVNRAGQTGNVYTLSTIDENVADTGAATTFANVSAPIRDTGQDTSALINGVVARGDGRDISINTDALDIDLTLTVAGATAVGTINALTVSNGGAKFNLGSSIDAGNQVRLGIQNVASRKLGNSTGKLDSLQSGGTNSLLGANLDDAQTIVNGAIDQVAKLRGRIGAFQTNVVGSTINALNVALENTSAAESAIRDTDFAKETAELTRSQILVAAATNVVSIANSRPQSALSLLG